MIRLHFTRKFHAGPLTGLTHDDKIDFVSLNRAREWVEGVNAKDDLGYKVIKWNCEALKSGK